MKILTQFESAWDAKQERYVTVAETFIEYEGQLVTCKSGGVIGGVLGDLKGFTSLAVEHALDPLDPTWTPQTGGHINKSRPLVTPMGGFNDNTWNSVAQRGGGGFFFDLTKMGNKVADVIAPMIAGGAFGAAGMGGEAGVGATAGEAGAGMAEGASSAGSFGWEGLNEGLVGSNSMGWEGLNEGLAGSSYGAGNYGANVQQGMGELGGSPLLEGAGNPETTDLNLMDRFRQMTGNKPGMLEKLGMPSEMSDAYRMGKMGYDVAGAAKSSLDSTDMQEQKREQMENYRRMLAQRQMMQNGNSMQPPTDRIVPNFSPNLQRYIAQKGY